MKRHSLMTIVSVAVLAVAPVAGAEEMILQAPPRVTLTAAAQEGLCDIFYVCSMWHEISPDYCTEWHVVYCGPVIEADVAGQPGKGFVGANLVVENRFETREVTVQKVVPQYHLASGAVVEPRGEWNAADPGGEDWGEVRPNRTRTYRIANWDDTNKDGLVGKGDRVTFANGTKSEIKDVRLGIHAEVVKSTPRQ